MDRTVYFATSGADQTRNGELQKIEVQAALSELELSTSLGEGYFSYQEADESAFSVAVAMGSSASWPKSFILLWPDGPFNSYAASLAATSGIALPDPNAIAVVNDANKANFFIIIRSSCIPYGAQPICQPGLSATLGFHALVSRQVGLILGLAAKDCAHYASDIMCADTPSDSQYSASSRLSFSSSANNVLESILLNPSYYPAAQ
jgi:hypothetical protein